MTTARGTKKGYVRRTARKANRKMRKRGPRQPLSKIVKVEWRDRGPYMWDSVYITSKSKSGRSSRRGMLAEELRIRRVK